MFENYKPISRLCLSNLLKFCYDKYYYADNDGDKIAIINYITGVLAHGDGQKLLNDKRTRERYVAQLHGFYAGKDKVDLNGSYPEQYAVLRTRLFVEIFIKIASKEISLPEDISLRDAITSVENILYTDIQSISMTSFIFKYLKNKNEFTSEQRDNLINIMAENIWNLILKLQDNEAYLMLTGWYGHTVYVNLYKGKIEIINTGGGRDKHLVDPSNQNYIYPYVFKNNMDVNNVNYQAAYKQYIANLLLSHLLDYNGGYKLIYNFDENLSVNYFRVLSKEELNYKYASYKIQSGPNCHIKARYAELKLNCAYEDSLIDFLKSEKISILSKRPLEIDSYPLKYWRREKLFHSKETDFFTYYLANYLFKPIIAVNDDKINKKKIVWSDKYLSINKINIAPFVYPYSDENNVIDYPFKILFSGKYGSGKTYAVYRYAQNMYDGKLIIFYIPIKQVYKNIEDADIATFLYNIYFKENPGCKVSVSDLEYCLETYQEAIVFLIDELDDIAAWQMENSAFRYAKIIIKQLLEYNVIVVSANGGGEIMKDINIQYDATIKVGEFAEADINQYIRSFFNQVTGKNLEARKLIQFIDSNSLFKKITAYPRNLEIICSLWHVKHNPKSITYIYYHLNKEILGKSNKYSPDCLMQLREVLMNLACQVHLENKAPARSYLKNIIEDQLENSNINIDFIVELENLGILKLADKNILSDEPVGFIHTSQLIYYAADYIVNQARNGDGRLIQDAVGQLKFYNIDSSIIQLHSFIAGLLSMNGRKIPLLESYLNSIYNLCVKDNVIAENCLQLVLAIVNEAYAYKCDQLKQLLDAIIYTIKFKKGENGNLSFLQILMHNLIDKHNLLFDQSVLTAIVVVLNFNLQASVGVENDALLKELNNNSALNQLYEFLINCNINQISSIKVNLCEFLSIICLLYDNEDIFNKLLLNLAGENHLVIRRRSAMILEYLVCISKEQFDHIFSCFEQETDLEVKKSLFICLIKQEIDNSIEFDYSVLTDFLFQFKDFDSFPEAFSCLDTYASEQKGYHQSEHAINSIAYELIQALINKVNTEDKNSEEYDKAITALLLLCNPPSSVIALLADECDASSLDENSDESNDEDNESVYDVDVKDEQMPIAAETAKRLYTNEMVDNESNVLPSPAKISRYSLPGGKEFTVSDSQNAVSVSNATPFWQQTLPTRANTVEANNNLVNIVKNNSIV
jgi:hypothetical protein